VNKEHETEDKGMLSQASQNMVVTKATLLDIHLDPLQITKRI
jgi:hypothetical protein